MTLGSNRATSSEGEGESGLARLREVADDLAWMKLRTDRVGNGRTSLQANSAKFAQVSKCESNEVPKYAAFDAAVAKPR